MRQPAPFSGSPPSPLTALDVRAGAPSTVDDRTDRTKRGSGVGDEIRVDPKAVSAYAGEMMMMGPKVTLKVPQIVSQMPATAQDAFNNITGAGVFAESALMMAAVERLSSELGSFNSDVQLGIQAIANAAEVCAVSYLNTDGDSANNIGLVDFAFADPTAGHPAGVGKDIGGTMLDQMIANQASQPDALTNPDGGQALTFPNGVLTTYPDGSTKLVYSFADGTASSGAVTSTSWTTIKDANGKVVADTSETTTSGGPTGVTTVVRLDGNSKTTETTNKDGSKVIVTTVDGKDVSTVNLPAPDPDDRPTDTSVQGPLETAVDAFGPGTGGVQNPGAAGDPSPSTAIAAQGLP